MEQGIGMERRRHFQERKEHKSGDNPDSDEQVDKVLFYSVFNYPLPFSPPRHNAHAQEDGHEDAGHDPTPRGEVGKVEGNMSGREGRRGEGMVSIEDSASQETSAEKQESTALLCVIPHQGHC